MSECDWRFSARDAISKSTLWWFSALTKRQSARTPVDRMRSKDSWLFFNSFDSHRVIVRVAVFGRRFSFYFIPNQWNTSFQVIRVKSCNRWRISVILLLCAVCSGSEQVACTTASSDAVEVHIIMRQRPSLTSASTQTYASRSKQVVSYVMSLACQAHRAHRFIIKSEWQN